MQEFQAMNDKVNVLLVDDQPAKLLANEEILRDLGENLIKAASAREALEFLLKNEAAVVLIDVCMPELDGFQLAAMIREHPRFQKTAIIFISAVQVDDVDRVRGYEMGAVDYVPVPVVPAVLRAKVKIFAELYRKTRQLERLNAELERRVTERTAELEASTVRLLQSEQGRSLALAAGQMGSWDFDPVTRECRWDEGQHHIFGVEPGHFKVTVDNIGAMIHPEDWDQLQASSRRMAQGERTVQTDFRVVQAGGSVRWCTGTAVASFDAADKLVRVSGVTIDVTERKEAEQRQDLLAREVDHRARNALAVVQSIVRLTRANSVDDYVAAVEGRIKALARAHALLSDSRWHSADLGALVAEELAPYRAGEPDKVEVVGPNVALPPHMAQGLALALHELATNAAKHGALSSMRGKVSLNWQLRQDFLVLKWLETGGPPVAPPSARSFGLKVIRASIENQLGGRTTFDWAPPGMQCVLSIPLRDAAGAREPKQAVNGAANGAKQAGSAASRRVLLVEDEALVAMMIQDCLTECGHSVIGPISRASDALQAARESDYDAAILDINLGDGMAYPVADIVSARGVPFVFVTGYEADTIDERFRAVPILQKPIERQVLEQLFLSGSSVAAVGRVEPPRAAKPRLAGVRPRAKRA
jgi:two-component sensor histidine kinase/DNA-binding response OmpR family regulator